MKLTKEHLDRIADYVQGQHLYLPPLEGSKFWVRIEREELLRKLGDIDFTEIRFLHDSLDCYIGNDWACSIAYRGENNYYIRRTGLEDEKYKFIAFWSPMSAKWMFPFISILHLARKVRDKVRKLLEK